MDYSEPGFEPITLIGIAPVDGIDTLNERDEVVTSEIPDVDFEKCFAAITYYPRGDEPLAMVIPDDTFIVLEAMLADDDAALANIMELLERLGLSDDQIIAILISGHDTDTLRPIVCWRSLADATVQRLVLDSIGDAFIMYLGLRCIGHQLPLMAARELLEDETTLRNRVRNMSPTTFGQFRIGE